MASSAAAIASVAPHVTVTSVSGSTLMPYHSPYFATRASRSRFAPQVMAYWFTSSWIARAAASFNTSGAAKLGNPWARLMAACSFASRVMPRITDLVKPWVRDPRHDPARERSEEHTSELQSQSNLVCRLLLEINKGFDLVVALHS